MKKRRKLRWNRVLMLIVVLVFCFSFAVNAFGDVPQNPSETEKYIDVTVADGDSLWSLIKEYNPEYSGNMNKAIYKVCNLNELENACLYSGQIILIPIDL